MSEVIARIEQTRDMLLAALAERNWEAVGELDLECRLRVGDMVSEAKGNEADVSASLEQLLADIIALAGSVFHRKNTA